MGWSVLRGLQRGLFVIAFLLPALAKATSRKTVHMIALLCGGIGLISVNFIASKWMLFASMAGVGMLGIDSFDALRDVVDRRAAGADGCVHGRLNLFIVIPQIVMSLIVPNIFNNVLGADPRNAVVLGGISY